MLIQTLPTSKAKWSTKSSHKQKYTNQLQVSNEIHGKSRNVDRDRRPQCARGAQGFSSETNQGNRPLVPPDTSWNQMLQDPNIIRWTTLTGEGFVTTTKQQTSKQTCNTSTCYKDITEVWQNKFQRCSEHSSRFQQTFPTLSVRYIFFRLSLQSLPLLWTQKEIVPCTINQH